MRLSLRLFLFQTDLVCSCSCLVTFFFLILFKTKNQGDMIGQLKKDPRPKASRPAADADDEALPAHTAPG